MLQKIEKAGGESAQIAEGEKEGMIQQMLETYGLSLAWA